MKRSGLSADAELVHQALTTTGPERPAALAGELGMSQERLVVAFTALREAGLIQSRGDGNGRRWEAMQQPESPASRRRLVPPHRPVPLPEPLRQLIDTVELGEGMRHLTSRAATNRRLFELYNRNPREVLGISPEPGFDESSLIAAARGSHWAKKIGMSQREIGLLPPDRDFLVPFGGLRMDEDTYRQQSEALMKLIVIDKQHAFFPVDPGNFERGYLEVSQPPVVEALVALFEREWNRAGTQPQEQAMNIFRLTPREQSVVAQLVLGRTDAATARALHMSERTISSIVSTMMERLEVRNRFQLGVALGRLGAAPMPPGPDGGMG